MKSIIDEPGIDTNAMIDPDFTRMTEIVCKASPRPS
jgi:hypothetical protein